MTSYFVSRHPGAFAWAVQQGVAAERVEHLDPGVIQPGDEVFGTLPVSVAAAICRRGARYLHLTIDTPPGHRGRELTAADMEAFNARLEEFEVRRIGAWTR